MSEIPYPDYRDYVSNRVEVNDAMIALLAGSRLAAHTLSLTTGSTATLAQLFPAVEHIERFNLRSDVARDLLKSADHHIASVAIPYALATHEDFVMGAIAFLENEGRSPSTSGSQIKAWNMHAVLFEMCGAPQPEEWLQSFHVLREMRNCITHAGGQVSQRLKDAVSNMGAEAQAGWEQLNYHPPLATVDNNGRLMLTAEHIFTAFAVTKRLGREINTALKNELDGMEWARVAVADFASNTSKNRNSSSWRRSLLGYASKVYAEANLTEDELESAARYLGAWTKHRWE